MLKSNLFGWWFALIFLALSLNACIKDDLEKMQVSNWNPEMALALVDSRFGIDRIINSAENFTNIEADSNNVVTIVYSGEFFELNAHDIINIQDFQFNLLAASGKLPFPFQGQFIKNIKLNQGLLKIDAASMQTDDISLNIKIPKATKDGQFFEIDVLLDYNGNVPVELQKTFPLNGYRFDLTGNGSETNVIEIIYEAKRISDGVVVQLSKCDVSFENLRYDFIDGFFGNLDLGKRDESVEINLFKNFKSGSVLLKDPSIALKFENSFGIPIVFSLESLKGEGTQGNRNLNGKIIDDTVSIGGSNDSENGNPTTSIEFIHSGNSNITNFIAITPSSLDLSFNLQANKDKDTSQYNFLFGSSSLKGFLDLKIPLSGSIDSVVIEDVYDFHTDDLEKSRDAQFKIWTENRFPLGIFFQLYFLDNNEDVFDSLVLDNTTILAPAATNEEGFAISTSIEEGFYHVDQERFKTIKEKAKKVKIRSMLLTDKSDERTVNISANDYFIFRMGLKTTLYNF